MDSGKIQVSNIPHRAVHAAADAHSILAITDADGLITWVNDNFVRRSGYSRKELIGKTHKVINSDYHPRKFFKILWQVISAGKIWHGRVRNRAKNGEFYWVDTTILPVINAQGVITGYTSIRTDITNLVLERNLRKAEAKKAKKANQAKSEFLAMMSHELRTPMNAIIGSAQMLQSCRPGAEENEYIKTILDGGEILMAVLNDILDFSKIEAGKLEINANAVDVAHLVQRLHRFWLPRAQDSSVDLDWSIDENVPGFVKVDGTRLRQILYNLLSNAIKFSANGKVRVVVSLADQANGINRLRFRVSDTGIGISKKAQSRLFGAFEQADKSIAGQYGGTGLGLAISRRLARLMDGDITVKSEEGAGASFTLELAAPAVAQSPVPARSTSPINNKHAPQLHRLSILAAEDNALNRKVLAAFLKLIDADLSFAEDGEQALKMLQEMPFDVALMDIQMPKMDGIEVVKNLRNCSGPNQDIPVIAMTANALQGDRERYLAAGMTGYVSKPIDLRKLVSAISRAAQTSRLDRLSGPADKNSQSQGVDSDGGYPVQQNPVAQNSP